MSNQTHQTATGTIVPKTENITHMEKLFSCEQVGQIMQMPVRTVWRLCRDGRLPHRRISRKCIRVAESDLAQLLTRAAR